MTRQERIELLQSWVEKNIVKTADDLKLEISCAEYEGDEPIEWFDDILAPLEWNCCDRCGALYPSEELYWLDYCEPSEYLIAGAVKEKVDYCAVCEDCAKELTTLGKEQRVEYLEKKDKACPLDKDELYELQNLKNGKE